MSRLVLAALLATVSLPAVALPVAAQEGVTVAGLMAVGWVVVGIFPSSAGPGILLQKEQSLEICFVAETPDSADIKTQYCKPVH